MTANEKVQQLEQQLLELLHQLAGEKHQGRQAKLLISKLQQQLARLKSEQPVVSGGGAVVCK